MKAGGKRPPAGLCEGPDPGESCGDGTNAKASLPPGGTPARGRPGDTDHRIALAHDLETVLCRQGPRDAEQLLDKIGDTWGRPVAQAAIEMLAQICGSDCGELRASFIHDQRAHFATEDQLDDTFEPRGTTKAGRGS